MSISSVHESKTEIKPDASSQFDGPSGCFTEGLFSTSPDVYSLIHGNKSATPHKQGLYRPFDDFNPDHSDLALFDRLNRYAKAHSRAVAMSDFIKDLYHDSPRDKRSEAEQARALATELKECGSFLHFRHYYTINQIKLAAMCSCKRHLLCPLCAIRRAAKAVKAYLERFNVLVEENPHLHAYLVTFTVKDGYCLEERFDHLQSSLAKYTQKRRRATKSKRHSPVEGNKAHGGVGSYEVKRGSGSGLWHPHAHFVWLCESAPDVARLKAEWQEITGDSFIVDVTPFYDRENVSKGFLEVFKYALKYGSMSLSDNWEAYGVLQRRRLVTSFGNFRGVDLPDQLTDEITFDELPYIELIFRYMKGGYHLTTCSPSQPSERSE